MPKVVIYIVIAMLFVGVLSLPYGYYMLLRFVVCGLCAWTALIAHNRNEEILPWAFILLAILFNPIIKIYFPKELWAVIDFSVGIFLLFIRKRIISN